MGFRQGAYATIWEVEALSDVNTKARISISRKNKQTGEYNRVMSGYECDDLVYIDLQDDIDNVYTSLVMCLCNMLKNIDFDKEVIVFWESY